MKSTFAIILLSFLLATPKDLFAQKTILDDEILTLVSPIQLGSTETHLKLRDYFQNIGKVESLKISTNHGSVSFDKNTGDVLIQSDADMPVLSWLTVVYIGKPYSFVLKKNQKQFCRFVFKELPGKSPGKIYVKGSFNNWSPDADAMHRNDGSKEWILEKWLDPGTHVYKYVVDGIEINDPYNSAEIGNGMGGTNSVIYVKEQDVKLLPVLSFTEIDSLKSIIKISVSAPSDLNKSQFFVLWQNEKIDFKLDQNQKCILIKIPAASKKYARSHIRVYCMDESGIGNDLLIPLQNSKVIQNTSQLTRQDWQSMILYFSLVDRFNNGDKSNDQPLKDDRLQPIQNYYGGDIKGITEKIKSGYFKQLGMNTIWLSPITQNPWEAYQEFPQPRRWYSGYHGYWPMYTTVVDKRFGNEIDLKELVETAHQNNMNVLLDYVCHHVHIKNKMYQDHKDWATPLTLPDGRTNIRIWDEQRLTTWFDDFLPTLDLSKPEVAQIQSDSALFWIKKYKLDGFRHDATKHVPIEFWRMLTQKMKTDVILKEKRSVYQIGETFGNNELISSYIGSGLLDAQFNFNLYFDVRDEFSAYNGNLNVVANSLRQSCNYFGYNNTMGVITGNHDLTRFMGLASRAVRPDEDSKEAGYARDIQILDRKGYKRLQNLLSFIMTVPGIPIVYYGDEIGMVGAGDPDNRRPMRFEGLNTEENETKKICSELAGFRATHMSLLYGNLEILQSEHDLMVYSRSYLNDKVWVCYNTSADPKTVSISVKNTPNIFTRTFTRQALMMKPNSFEIVVPPQSFEIIYTQ